MIDCQARLGTTLDSGAAGWGRGTESKLRLRGSALIAIDQLKPGWRFPRLLSIVPPSLCGFVCEVSKYCRRYRSTCQER